MKAFTIHMHHWGAPPNPIIIDHIRIFYIMSISSSFYTSDVSSSPNYIKFHVRYSPCDDGDDDAVAAATAAAAAFASLSTLSAYLMCGVNGPGMPRKWELSLDLRLLGVDQEADCVYGDASDIELLREGMESGCR